MTHGGVPEVYEMLLAVSRSLVDRPEDVEIVIVPCNETIVFRVRVHPKDTGKLIGSNGRMSRAIRIILNSNGLKHRQNFALDIVDTKDIPNCLPDPIRRRRQFQGRASRNLCKFHLQLFYRLRIISTS